MSYITYTYHYIDNWKINSYVLKTCAFDQSATAENIITHYEDTLTDLRLTNKKVIFVTDGGSNLKEACRLMNVIRLDCIAHKIHLLITTDLVQHASMKIFFQVFLEKMHKVHYALLFKYRELKMYDNEERQRKFNEAVNEAADMGDYCLFCLLISFNLFRFGIMLCWVVQKKYLMQSNATNWAMRVMIYKWIYHLSVVYGKWTQHDGTVWSKWVNRNWNTKVFILISLIALT